MFFKERKTLEEYSKWLKNSLCKTGKMILMVVGAHDDDPFIGSGPVLMNMLRHIFNIIIVWVIVCSHDDRPERRDDITTVAREIGIPDQQVLALWFNDGHMDDYPGEVRKALWPLCKYIQPNVLLTHQSLDSNTEHNAVRAACVRLAGSNGTRLILGYDVPKPWPEQRFNPHLTIPVPEKDALAAAELLHLFGSELNRGAIYLDEAWFLARLIDNARRAGLKKGYAMSFEIIRFVAGIELFLALTSPRERNLVSSASARVAAKAPKIQCVVAR